MTTASDVRPPKPAHSRMPPPGRVNDAPQVVLDLEGRLTLSAALATVLSALGLSSVLTSYAWLPATLLTIAVVVATAELTRRRRWLRRPGWEGLPSALALLAYGLVLTVIFAPGAAVLGILPTPGVVAAFAQLLRSAGDEIRTQAAPAETSTALTFLAASGLGLVAVIVDTVAVTWRRPAAAGLALLAVYAVPAGLAPNGVSWVAFSLGAAGFLLLLFAAFRVRVADWGRRLSRPDDAGPDPLAALGRRVAVMTLALAVLVPAVLPGLDEGFLKPGGSAGDGGGLSRVSVANPILDLGRNLTRSTPTEVLRYTTDSPTPGYLRLVSLDDFTGNVWQPSPLRVPRGQSVDRGMPPVTGLSSEVAAEPVHSTITVTNLDSPWLPLPYPAREVKDLRGLWLWDGPSYNVFGVRGTTRSQTYRVTSLDVQPSQEQLSAAPSAGEDLSRFLTVPDRIPSIISRQAREVTAKMDTDYAKAVALQDWLRNPDNFTYDVTAPDGSGVTAIAQFLQRRKGFCVHFASTLALMARTLGIPSRVAVGYTTGTPSADGYVVSTTDAHAWPELFFQGAGWLAFEPTPAQRTGEPPAYARPRVAATGSATPTTGTSASNSPSPTLSTSSAAPTPRSTNGSPSSGGAAGAFWAAMAQIALLVVLIVVLLLIPGLIRMLARTVRWRRAGTDPARLTAAAWAEVRDDVRDFRLRAGTDTRSLTPRQFAAAVTAEADLEQEAADALSRVARSAERLAYAPALGPLPDLRHDVSVVREALVHRAHRTQLLLALAWPASLIGATNALWNRVADGLDWIDRGLVRVRRQAGEVARSPRSGRPSDRRGRGGAAGRGHPTSGTARDRRRGVGVRQGAVREGMRRRPGRPEERRDRRDRRQSTHEGP